MNKINYKESINIDSLIKELILINVDENISLVKEEDFVNFTGEIRISGEVETDKEKKEFNHPLTLDISLSKEQLINDSPSISIDDFKYVINENLIDIELSLKIEGLKEIENEFPAPESEEIVLSPIEDLNVNTPHEDEIIETLESDLKEHSTLMNQLFKRSIKKTKAYLIHVVKEETSYDEIAQLYNTDIDILKDYNKNKELNNGSLIFIPNTKWKTS